MHSCCVSVRRMLPGISEPRCQDLGLGKGGGEGRGGGGVLGQGGTPNPCEATRGGRGGG